MGPRRVGRWRQQTSASSSRDEPDARTYTRTLVVHEERFQSSRAEVCLNPEAFPGLRIGDLISIQNADRDHDQALTPFQTCVSELNPVKGNVQISVRKGIADLFELKNRAQVLVRILTPNEAVSLDFLQLSFSDQYISRGDMWRLKQDLIGSCVYSTKLIMSMGFTARADELLVSGQAVLCGMITPATKLVYRSRSAKVTWLIQLSKEMWEYDDRGQLYEENLVNGLLKFVFGQWQRLGVQHSLSVVLFARTFFTPVESRAPVWGPKPPGSHSAQTLLADVSNVFQTDHQQRLFQDFYKLVFEGESRRDWATLRSLLIRDINRFSQELRWGAMDPISGLKGVPTSAADGNILEAINLAANTFDKHFLDRDLHRTAQTVVVATAGTGVWNVDHRLLELTKERMVDNGIGCDLISLARPPLHAVPLFVYNLHGAARPSGQPRYCIADDWLGMKFWAESRLHSDLAENDGDEFIPIPLCRMFPSLQLQPADLDWTFSPRSVIYPYTPVLCDSDTAPPVLLNPDYYDLYDGDVFRFGDDPGLTDSVAAMLGPVGGRCHSGSFPSLGPAAAPISSSPKGSRPGPGILTKTLSMSALDRAPPTEFVVPVQRQTSFSGSPSDLVPKRWASPPNPSSCSPAASATLLTAAASKIRLDSTGSARMPDGSAAPGRQQVLFEVQHDALSRPILVESYAAPWSATSEPSDPLVVEGGAESVPNPFSLHSSVPKLANNRRRWVHLFPKQEEPVTQLNLKSLCTPAVLPLTTDYFPNLDQLQKEFRHTVHTLSLVPDDRRYHDRAANLLMELITQRLTHDFQLMVAPTASPQSIQYQLSLGGDHHQVILDRSADNIQVRRYVRHSTVAHDPPWAPGQHQPAFPYRYFLWSDACQGLLPVDALIRASNADIPFNWNYVDQLVAGHVDAITGPNINYRRIRFALISASALSPGCVQDVDRLTTFLETLFGRDVTDLNLRWVSQIREPLGSGSLDAFVNVDLGFVDGADRYQSFSVYYDSIVDSSACFHIEVRWMMATGASIRRWISDVLRPIAKDVQVVLLQLPACHYQPRNPDTFLPSSTSPFLPLIPISLPSPLLITVVRSYIILPRFDYILDTTLTSPIQYLHTSGMSMIRIEAGGLQWIPHPKFSSHARKQQFAKIQELCFSLIVCRDTIVSIINDVVDNINDIQIC